MKRCCPCDDFDHLRYTGVLRVPKRGSQANFHRLITVPRGHSVPGWRWKGQGQTTLVPNVAPPVKLRGYHRGALLCRLYQLPFDSKLRPPPMYVLAFRSVPQSPPTINAIHTKPILAPLAPDLAQCLCHVCTSLELRAPSRPIAIEQPHILTKLNKLISQV